MTVLTAMGRTKELTPSEEDLEEIRSAPKGLGPFVHDIRDAVKTMPVAMHNHSNVTDPNEFATLESLATALTLSPLFRINLDIGHFTAANYDAVAYIREHHASITNLHLKDRKKEQGPNTAWGTGDTPIRQVLQLLKQERWPIRAYIEYEHNGEAGPVDEVKKCFAFAKSALA